MFQSLTTSELALASVQDLVQVGEKVSCPLNSSWVFLFLFVFLFVLNIDKCYFAW